MSNLCHRPIYQKGRKPAVVPKLRNAARGQRCTLRLSCCNHDPETVVLAHLRCFGWAGTGQKPSDYKAVFACSACHDQIDRRARDAEWGYDDLLRALGETLDQQYAAGNLRLVGGYPSIPSIHPERQKDQDR